LPILARLPPAIRNQLSDPMGQIYTTIEDLLPVLGFPLITVGDVVTSHFNLSGRPPNVSIIDHLTQRKPISPPPDPLHVDFFLEVENPPASLTEELIRIVYWAVNEPSGISQILVDGEEDLAVLPAVVSAPIGSSVVYGQPNMGMVHVPVTPETQRRVWDLLSKFDGDVGLFFKNISKMNP
jgi:uncharacterized protein (UPF0218 family)